MKAIEQNFRERLFVYAVKSGSDILVCGCGCAGIALKCFKEVHDLKTLRRAVSVLSWISSRLRECGFHPPVHA